MRAHLRSWSIDRRSAAGFTLVEMLVTLAIFAVVAVTLTLVVMNSAKSKQRTTQRIESEQGARAAVDLMARDIRSAGYGADLDDSPQQPAISYVDSKEIILTENQSPYPDPTTAAPQAYNPAGNPKPFPLNATAWQPPMKYTTGAEQIRYTLDVNNDGVVDANDVASAQGADAAATPNPNDYVLVRQVFGDMTGGTAGNNGGTTERVALVRRPGDAGVPSMYTVYMKGSSTPYDWANGPVPAAQLQNIQRIELAVMATASRPDNRGQYAQTTIKTQVNAARSVPDFGLTTYTVSGYVFNDLNMNRVMDGSDAGIAGATVRMGSFVSYTNNSGFYQFRAPAGSYTLRHVPAMGYGSFAYPDTFAVTISTAAISQSFADTARKGGLVDVLAYDDVNGNGVRDTGENGLSSIRFTITPGTPEKTSDVTDAGGHVQLFTGVGGFSVTCNRPDSLFVTDGDPKTGTMTNGGSASLAFGLNKQVIGHIRGKVFVDANRNGNFDSGELGMGSVWVGVTKDGGVNVLAYGYTDANGDYDLATPINDPPHTDPYAVYTIPPAGYFPTTTMSIGGLWLRQNPTLNNNNFGMANFQIITLNASRVLSLAAADLVEKDWNGGHTENARADLDLVLGADAGGTDNVSVWFNRYATSPLFNATPTNPDGYTRLAPNSVMSMAVDTLDKNDNIKRPDLVTGTKFTAGGNFFVWYTQGSSNNEGFLPANYNTGQNYRTQDNGDVQSVVTLDCGGGNMPDIVVGTKGATAGQGSLEVWLNDNNTTPSFTRDETFNTIGGVILGEVTGMVLVDLDNDGDKDLVVVTHQSDYNGQMFVLENRGRTAGSRFVYRYGVSFGGSAPTCVAAVDADGDGWKDIFVGSQRSTSAGNVWQIKNTGITSLWTFSIIRAIDAGGITQSITTGDYGGGTRGDIAVGTRSSTVGFGGGVRIYYLDTGVIGGGSDPSAGSVVNMVPAVTSGNFNYGLNTTTPPSPYLTDLAAGIKASASTGAIVVFIR
jgi:prepilin-type N-terminal cleavage/methylation domain-containing protein